MAPGRAALLLLGAVSLAAAGSPAARAEDPPPKPAPKEASDDDAKAALERFGREFDTEDEDHRIDAVKALRRVLHPSVADRLLDVALKAKEIPVRAEAFKSLSRQKSSAARVGPRLAKWLADEAEANRKAKARGDYGVLIDVKTGEPDYESPEGKEKLRRKKERGAMLAEAAKCMGALEYRAGADALVEFLQDGNDDLVAEILAQLGKTKEWRALPALLDLYEMYPKEDEFQTGSVSVDTGAAGSADQSAARRKWMAKYGDPDKRRARPVLVRALKQCLKDITGQEFATPKDLRAYLKRPEVEKKVKAR